MGPEGFVPDEVRMAAEAESKKHGMAAEAKSKKDGMAADFAQQNNRQPTPKELEGFTDVAADELAQGITHSEASVDSSNGNEQPKDTFLEAVRNLQESIRPDQHDWYHILRALGIVENPTYQKYHAEYQTEYAILKPENRQNIIDAARRIFEKDKNSGMDLQRQEQLEEIFERMSHI